jgi:hypothetical protein
MKTFQMISTAFVALSAAVLFGACGGDDGEEADRVGIGAECANNEACTETDQTCLTEFKGGYCGKTGCTSNKDCPEASACVSYDNGTNYCFRICVDKAECNQKRTLENQSNCSSSVTFVEPATNVKACVPPSSGVDTTNDAGGKKGK